MPINTDAFIYAGLFAPGDTAEHALAPGRGAWVQVVEGIVSVAGVTLESGDGVGITDAAELSFSFGAESEVLIFDVRMDAERLWT
jgi:redox-sensitive bicupin YhaK (pirin superfamily)